MKIEFDYSNLIKLFKKKKLHEYQVAFYLNMSPKTFRDKLRSKSYFTQKDIYKLIVMLDIPVSEIDTLFFNTKSSKNREIKGNGDETWI